MEANKILNSILDHPFVTAFVVGTVVNGVVKCVAIAKGIEIKPAGLSISFCKDDKPKT